MLFKTLPMAIPFAQALAEQGIQIAVPTNSDLSVLVTHSVSDSPSSKVSAEDFVRGVENATVVGGQMTDYEGYKEALVRELVGPVKSHIRMSQEVGAMVTNMGDMVRNFAQKTQDSSATEKFRVAKDSLSDVFEMDQIRNALTGNVAVNRVPDLGLVTGSRSRDEILGLIAATGNEKLDGSVVRMVEQFDNYQWLDNIYYAFICVGGRAMTDISPNYMDAIPAGERAAAYLVVGLICSRFVENVPTDAIGSLQQFREKASTLRDYAFSRAGAAVVDYESTVRRSVLICNIRSQNDTRTVYVNDTVYGEWLDAGGRPELLMAVALTGNSGSTTVAEVTNKLEELTRVWNNYCATHRSLEAVRVSQVLRSIYISTFVESMSDVQVFEEEYRKANPRHAELSISAAQKWLETVSIETLNDFDEVSLELLGRFRFSYLPAYEILKEINRIRKDSEEIPVREAALVAATKYVARYQITQMSISRTK